MFSESLEKQNVAFVPTFLPISLEMHMVKENNKHHTETPLIRLCFHTGSFNTSEREALILASSEAIID